MSTTTSTFCYRCKTPLTGCSLVTQYCQECHVSLGPGKEEGWKKMCAAAGKTMAQRINDMTFDEMCGKLLSDDSF